MKKNILIFLTFILLGCEGSTRKKPKEENENTDNVSHVPPKKIDTITPSTPEPVADPTVINEKAILGVEEEPVISESFISTQASLGPRETRQFSAQKPSLVSAGRVHPVSTVISAWDTFEEKGEAEIDTLADMSTSTRFQNASSTVPVFLEVKGYGGLYNYKSLNEECRLSALHCKKADIEIEEGGKLITTAALLQGSDLQLLYGSKFRVSSLRLDENSTIRGKSVPEFDPLLEGENGISLETFSKNHTEYSWAQPGVFIIDGSMDELAVTPGVNLSTTGSGAKINYLQLKGGDIRLKSSQHMKVDDFSILKDSNLHLDWDAQNPDSILKIAKTFEREAHLRFNLISISPDIKEGDKIKLLSFFRASNTEYKKDIRMLGLDLMLEETKDSMFLFLKKRNSGSELLSNSAEELSQQLLRSAQRSRVEVLDADSAVRALNRSSAVSQLATSRAYKISFQRLHNDFSNMRDGLRVTSYGSPQFKQNAIGVINDHKYAAVSFSQNKGVLSANKSAALHFGGREAFTDFSVDQDMRNTSCLGIDIGKRFGNFDVCLRQVAGSATYLTSNILGNIYVPSFQFYTTTAELNFTKSITNFCRPIVTVGGRLSYDLKNSIKGHAMYVNGEKLTLRGYEANNLSFQFDAHFKAEGVELQASYGSCMANKIIANELSICLRVSL